MSALLETALAYAADGIPVLPLHTPAGDGHCSCGRRDCESSGKHPRTLHGLKDATTDTPTIRKWWKWWPDANIGVRTGTPGGILGLDFDSSNAELRLAELLSLKTDELGGLIVATGRGVHRWYQVPDGVEIPNSAGRLGPGIDVRGKGGYLVAPPSPHASGRRYAFTGGTLGLPPDSLLAELTTRSAHIGAARPPAGAGRLPIPPPDGSTTRYGQGVITRRCQAVREAMEGDRNYALLRAATTCAGYAATGEINLDDARAALTAAAHDAGLDARETARTIESGFKRGLADPLYRPPSYRERLLAARSPAERETNIGEATRNG